MRRLAAAAALGFLVMAAGCVGSGPGADFDDDGLRDAKEDTNDNFELDPGESDFLFPDTDGDGVCDGLPPKPLAGCIRCEDCNDDGFWEPCLNETDPLNDDTDNDGANDANDPAPLDRFPVDCSGGNNPNFAYGASLPPGESPPVRVTPTPTPAPFPTSTPTR